MYQKHSIYEPIYRSWVDRGALSPVRCLSKISKPILDSERTLIRKTRQKSRPRVEGVSKTRRARFFKQTCSLLYRFEFDWAQCLPMSRAKPRLIYPRYERACRIEFDHKQSRMEENAACKQRFNSIP